MERYGIKPVHSLGQNFLADGNILRKITELLALDRDDTVCEVGPGFGALTQELAERAGRVIAIEKDARMVPVLKEVLGDAFGDVRQEGAGGATIVVSDFLDYDLSALPAGYKLTGNLPYYITTPAMMKALESPNAPSLMVFMMQREVAERICAAPGGKEYGAVSVAVQYRCVTEYAMDISREVFVPKPHVDSAVIVLKSAPGRRGTPKDERVFFASVKAGFGQRRKMLRNALSALVPDPGALDAAFARAGVKGTARAETLSVEEFIALSNAITDTI
jgi:16S rRNA (adenine1518-N6/adenine1519-N6)-dimethyltransferase